MSKNNTDQTKALLQRVISSCPADFALREVKFHLQQAANKLEQVEKKRAAAEQKKSPTQHQQWHERLAAGLRNPNTAKNTLDIIDGMLAEEYAKLEDILERKKKTSTGDDEGETILG